MLKGYQLLDNDGGLTNPSVASIYQNQNKKSNVRIWTGQAATGGAGVEATFNPTSDNTATGTALFTNIYAVIATAQIDTPTATTVSLASVKAISPDKRTITVSAVSGIVLVALGATMELDTAVTVHLVVIGD